MIAVVGVFGEQGRAARAFRDFQILGLRDGHIDLLRPGASEKQLGQVPTADSEPPGMARTMGTLVGGAVGLGAGFLLGAAVGSLLTVGPVLMFGFVGAAMLGFVGAVGGRIAGKGVDDAVQKGLPADEFILYKKALRRGRSVLICEVPDEIDASEARRILKREGAESIDAAGRLVWLGLLRDPELRRYQMTHVEAGDLFSRGFDAGVNPEFHGKPWDQVVYLLAERYRDWYTNEFRRGFDRGQLSNGLPSRVNT